MVGIYCAQKCICTQRLSLEGRFEVFDVHNLAKRVFDTLDMAMIDAETNPPKIPTTKELACLDDAIKAVTDIPS